MISVRQHPAFLVHVTLIAREYDMPAVVNLRGILPARGTASARGLKGRSMAARE